MKEYYKNGIITMSIALKNAGCLILVDKITWQANYLTR